jgi:hypothetical protein
MLARLRVAPEVEAERARREAEGQAREAERIKSRPRIDAQSTPEQARAYLNHFGIGQDGTYTSQPTFIRPTPPAPPASERKPSPGDEARARQAKVERRARAILAALAAGRRVVLPKDPQVFAAMLRAKGLIAPSGA